MTRANRHFPPGHVWHITHRCHKREFLLAFVRDRMLWRYWLYEARRRWPAYLTGIAGAGEGFVSVGAALERNP